MPNIFNACEINLSWVFFPLLYEESECLLHIAEVYQSLLLMTLCLLKEFYTDRLQLTTETKSRIKLFKWRVKMLYPSCSLCRSKVKLIRVKAVDKKSVNAIIRHTQNKIQEQMIPNRS